MEQKQKNIFLRMPPMAVGTVGHRTIAGEDYQVYPCIMLVEGVHQGVGSDPVYYSPSLLSESAPMWNNLPVTVGHPVNLQGDHVLCNEDGTIRQRFQIGHLVNVHEEGGKLKADLWINVKKANDKAPELLPFLERGGELQVSTGMLAALDGVAGTWNEEDYVGAVATVVPDHLALLPGGTGACSWADGCGVRINQKKVEKERLVVFMEQDLRSQLDSIHQYVDSMDEYDQNAETFNKINFVRAVYESHFIYQQKVRQADGTEATKLYKQNYSMNSDGQIEVSDDPVEVVEEIKYKAVANESSKYNTGGTKMGEKEKKCCPEQVAALIANEATAYTEDDRDWLESLNEDQLDKMEVSEPEPKIEPEPDPEVKPEEVTLASYLQEAPPEIRAVLNEGMKALDNKRQLLMEKIAGHEDNSFDEDTLKRMDTEMLMSVAALIPEKAQPKNYLGANPQNSVIVGNEGEVEEAYVPVTLSDNLGKKKED